MPVQDYDPTNLSHAVRETVNNTQITIGTGDGSTWVWRWGLTSNGAYHPAWLYTVPTEIYNKYRTRHLVPNFLGTTYRDLINDTLTDEQRRGYWLDRVALEAHMEADELDPEDRDGRALRQEEPQTPVKSMPTFEINRKRKYHVHLRIRKKNDFESPPSYATVALYPSRMTMDEYKNPVDPSDPEAHTVWVEFGPTMMEWLKKEGERNPHAEFDLMIPTLDNTLVIYLGTLYRQEMPPPHTGWYYDINPSSEILEMLRGEQPEGFEVPEVPPGMDPFIAVLRRGLPT